jgi:hypothetical protein
MRDTCRLLFRYTVSQEHWQKFNRFRKLESRGIARGRQKVIRLKP